jgi:protein SCO1/2
MRRHLLAKRRAASRMGENMKRSAIAGALAVALAIAPGFAALAGAAGFTPAAGPVRLLDHTGRTVAPQDFTGKPSLVVFGFTSCPSICPTMLLEVSKRMADLGPLAERLNVIFISVDPERDTPEILREYLAAFDTRIIGLTGKIAGIQAVADAVGAKFEKTPLQGGGYTVDHSGMAFLLGSDGKRTGLLALGPGTDEARANAKLRALVGDAGH